MDGYDLTEWVFSWATHEFKRFRDGELQEIISYDAAVRLKNSKVASEQVRHLAAKLLNLIDPQEPAKLNK